jgi:hypothetical protein
MYIYKKVPHCTDIVDITIQLVDDTIVANKFCRFLLFLPKALSYVFLSVPFFKLVQIIATSGPSPHLPSNKT